MHGPKTAVGFVCLIASDSYNNIALERFCLLRLKSNTSQKCLAIYDVLHVSKEMVFWHIRNNANCIPI